MLPIMLLLQPATAAAPDYELQPSDGHVDGHSANIVSTVLKGAGEQPGKPPSGASPSPNGYLAIIANAAQHFRAFGPLGGNPCGRRVKTSVTAAGHQCRCGGVPA